MSPHCHGAEETAEQLDNTQPYLIICVQPGPGMREGETLRAESLTSDATSGCSVILITEDK